MSGFIEGENRFQSTLFPERVDDYVEEDSVVRVIDVFIDRLDISGLGFKAEPAETGRPGYHPRTMLKIYVYGYLNQVHSSRRLEREAGRNVELMWLSGRLAPDFKTIANFRKDNGEAIRLAAVEASIERYLGELDQADRSAPPEDTRPLKDRIAALTEEMDRLKKLEVRMLEAPDQQLSLTDPDARSMRHRGSGIVGYNLQTSVDVDHHLIVAHEVTNALSDRRQLTRMAQQAKAVIQTDSLNVLADRGYYSGPELRSCEQNDIVTDVPNSATSNNKAKGQFDRSEFHYIAKDDEYECPAGERLIYRFTRTESDKEIRRYWSSACPGCPIHAQCTTGKNRRVSRWVHEDVIERTKARLVAKPDAMHIRRATVEHPYGTLKGWMGSTHFLTKTLDHVSTEMSLHVLAYNMKRVINLIGTKRLLEAI
jgi:transposase